MAQHAAKKGEKPFVKKPTNKKHRASKNNPPSYDKQGILRK